MKIAFQLTKKSRAMSLKRNRKHKIWQFMAKTLSSFMCARLNLPIMNITLMKLFSFRLNFRGWPNACRRVVPDCASPVSGCCSGPARPGQAVRIFIILLAACVHPFPELSTLGVAQFLRPLSRSRLTLSGCLFWPKSDLARLL